MKYWSEYEGHVVDIRGQRNQFDNIIFTFDIETTSFLKLNNKIIPAINYLKLSKKEQEEAEPYSTMYIWMFSVNDIVYYGRTWDEFYQFLNRIEFYSGKYKRFVYVHNLSYELQFMRNRFKLKNVFSRQKRKVIRFEIEEFNFEFRCSYMFSNCSLENLSHTYKLPVEKLVGNLDYSKLRNSKTKLDSKELSYCENDCLVLYYYIKKELETYETIKNLPLTSTGKLRKEFQKIIDKNYKYKYITKKSINVDPHIYNLLVESYAGGYTHSNWIYTNDVIFEPVESYDFCSSYPYCMVAFDHFPTTEFRKCNITKKGQLLDQFCYIIVVKLYDVKCKYFNNFISLSKVREIHKPRYDNGRIISAQYIEMCVTDIDLKFFFESYNIKSYEFSEVYWSKAGYLPKEYIEFVLEHYEQKTKYKNVKGEEVRYNIEKQFVNSLYGMCVTQNIRNNIIFDNNEGWNEEAISNDTIIELLNKEKFKGFNSFSWGVWITSIARTNLLYNVIKLDKKAIYMDTDSIKVFADFDRNVIEEYNKNVLKRLEKASKDLGIPLEKFMPRDKKGKKHPLRFI